MQKYMLTHFTAGILAVSLLSLSQSACSLFSVYKIDIPQGSPLTQRQIAQVQLGMTQDQVRYLLGTPNITDTLNPNRWDYLYNYTPGTIARDAGLKPEKGQHLILTFDDGGKVVNITGAATYPVSQPGLPDNKDPVTNVGIHDVTYTTKTGVTGQPVH